MVTKSSRPLPKNILSPVEDYSDDDDYEEYKISPIDDDGESHIYAKLARPGTHSYMMPRQHCSAAGAVTLHCNPSAGMVLSQSLSSLDSSGSLSSPDTGVRHKTQPDQSHYERPGDLESDDELSVHLLPASNKHLLI